LPLSLNDIFPNADKGLSDIGFFFGAGTSKEAGYFLTNELTRRVVANLIETHKSRIQSILDKEGISHDIKNGIPDIEIISDAIAKHRLTLSDKDIITIEDQIQHLIVNEIVSVDNPNLEYHVLFLKALKSLFAQRPDRIWIFTTNYDLLFEQAAMKARINLINGFQGALYRYFDEGVFNLDYGTIINNRFEIYKGPRVILVKLHGSISWCKDDGEIVETSDKDIHGKYPHSLILPRKHKILDTLEHPFDKMFRYASNIIGKHCKYIACCGHSLRDEHINDYLFIPKLRDRAIKMTALFEELPENIEIFKDFPSFQYCTKATIAKDGIQQPENNEYWKFSEFVNLIARKAGKGV